MQPFAPDDRLSPLRNLVAYGGFLRSNKALMRGALEMMRTDPATKIGAVWMLKVAYWNHCGASVFQLTDSLTAALLLTDVRGNNWPEDVYLPLSAFLLMIPPGFFTLFKSDCRYIMVTREDQLLQPLSRPGFPMVPTVGMFSTHNITFDNNADDDFAATIAITDGFRDLKFGGFWDDACHPPTPETRQTCNTAMALSRRIAIGFSCWVANLPPGHPAREHIRRCQSRTVVAPEVIVVGREVKLSRDLRDAAKDLASAAQRRGHPGWRLRLKHVVRGHWRNQACGPNHSERKRTWIEPYWKGPDGAPGMSHIYGVST